MSNASVLTDGTSLTEPQLHLEPALEGANHFHADELPEVLQPARTLEEAGAFEGPLDDRRRIDYLPTPAEIHDACASIRSTWSMSEKRRRFVGAHVPDEIDRVWQPPVIDTSHFRISVGGVNADMSN